MLTFRGYPDETALFNTTHLLDMARHGPHAYQTSPPNVLPFVRRLLFAIFAERGLDWRATGTGAGGESYWGTPFRDEHDMKGAARHDGRGVLAMANKGPGTNGQVLQSYLRLQTNLGLYQASRRLTQNARPESRKAPGPEARKRAT
jgi:hypothetical protein